MWHSVVLMKILWYACWEIIMTIILLWNFSVTCVIDYCNSVTSQFTLFVFILKKKKLDNVMVSVNEYCLTLLVLLLASVRFWINSLPRLYSMDISMTRFVCYSHLQFRILCRGFECDVLIIKLPNALFMFWEIISPCEPLQMFTHNRGIYDIKTPSHDRFHFLQVYIML